MKVPIAPTYRVEPCDCGRIRPGIHRELGDNDVCKIMTYQTFTKDIEDANVKILGPRTQTDGATALGG